MAAYLVVYSICPELFDDDPPQSVTDHWEMFMTEDRLDAKARATQRYEELIRKPDTFSASVARVLLSTDYEVSDGA
jgi:hypothetical protein